MATLTISETLGTRIYEQLQQAYPNEGGGFLLGDVIGVDVVIRDVHAVENVFETEEQYHRYAMTPKDWARLEDEADAKGLTLVGYYHSHPDHPAIPSEFDRSWALPNFKYLITSVQQGRADHARVWQLTADGSQFDELTLKVEG